MDAGWKNLLAARGGAAGYDPTPHAIDSEPRGIRIIDTLPDGKTRVYEDALGHRFTMRDVLHAQPGISRRGLAQRMKHCTTFAELVAAPKRNQPRGTSA